MLACDMRVRRAMPTIHWHAGMNALDIRRLTGRCARDGDVNRHELAARLRTSRAEEILFGFRNASRACSRLSRALNLDQR
jgi:hypothetical protein